MSSAQTPTTAFTQPFDWTTNKISILPSAYWGLFKAGEAATISTSDGSPVTVFDLYGRTVYSGAPRPLTLAAGHYFVQCNGDRNQFAVLPADYAGASFLGDIANNGWSEWKQRQERIQPAWVRTGASEWITVQPARGVWNWSELDTVLAHNPGRKLIAIATGHFPPSWVQPANLTSDYSAYVTALAMRYKDRIAAIEIWNEPYIHQFWYSPEWIRMLADLITAGREAIKAVDPNIIVLAPTWSSAGYVSGTASLAQYGFSAHIDGLSWHDYWSYRFPADQDMLESGTVHPGIFGRAQSHRDAARFDGPLYITEMGLFSQSALGIPYPPIDPGYTGGLITNAPGWSTGMARATKYAVMYRTAGAAVILPHVFSLGTYDTNEGHSSLYGWDHGYRGPTPKASAFLMSCHWLSDASLAGYRTLGEQIVLSAWQRPNNTSVVFAWSGESQSFALSTGSAFSITDIYGSSIFPATLNSHPILFHTNGPNAGALLESVMAALPPLNLPPVFEFLPNQTVFKDRSLRFSVRATDPDHDPLTYSASSLPPGAMLDPVTGAFFWLPAANQLGRYSITFIATDARGLSDSITTLISVLGSSEDGLVGWWKLDESSGTIASDSAGTNTGSLLGFGFAAGSGWGAGKIGNSLEFDGVDDHVNLDSSKLGLSNNFTISSWIRPRGDAFGVFFCLRSKYASSGFRLGVLPNNDLLIVGQTTTGLQITHFALEQIQDNAWNHVAAVYDKSIFTVYLNGTRVEPGYGATGDWGGDFVMNPEGVTRIGAESGEGSVGFFFDGLIDDVRAYNRTLSASEVMTLYHWPVLITPPQSPSNLSVNGK